MNTQGNTKRFFSWFVFIIIVALVIWGLVAAQQKAVREQAGAVLPTEIVAADHIRGSTAGTSTPVTLVEYGDFQCPACGSYYPIVERVIASTSPQTLRYVFRHFPLTQHANAVPAAKASEAAGKQGKFWEMYNILYQTQADWENAADAKTIFTGYAKTLGLDITKFSADFDSKAVMDIINNDYKGGAAAGINATPTFFINGKQITNPQSYDEFKKDIDNAVPKLSL